MIGLGTQRALDRWDSEPFSGILLIFPASSFVCYPNKIHVRPNAIFRERKPLGGWNYFYFVEKKKL